MADEMNIRTTITADSVQRIIGTPISIDYRSHPDEETVDPTVIFEKMKEKEVPPIKDIKTLKGTIYSYKNRRILTRWIGDVCAAFDLKSTTLCLAIQLTDAYITGSIKILEVSKCQLAAVCCLWIAAKFEEMDDKLPSIKKMVEICDNSYRKEEILEKEEAILSFFKWRLPHTTVINHFYLQIHLLSSTDLINPAKCVSGDSFESVTVKLLVMKSSERTWKTIDVSGETQLFALMPKLCAMAKLPLSKSVEVFQVFGENLIVTQKISFDTLISALPLNSRGETRLFVSNGCSDLVFVEYGSFIVLRTVNLRILDLAELLIQEVVTHVEFLQLHSYVIALGVLGLGMCIVATDLSEVARSVQYIRRKIGISGSLSHAAAQLLCTKYQEAMASHPEGNIFREVPSDILDRLEFCFTFKEK